MICPTLEEMRKAVPLVTNDCFVVIVRDGLNLRAVYRDLPPPLLQPAAQLYIGLYEWLHHLGCFEQYVILRLLNKSKLALQLYAVELTKSYDAFDAVVSSERLPPLPVLTSFYTIVDQRYAIWSGATAWYDADTDADVPARTGIGVTYLSCDLFGLFRSKQLLLQKLRGAHGENSGQA
jgi:hypothetical protein